MKFFLILGLIFASLFAQASEINVTLNFNNLLLTSQDSGAALIDLTKEIAKQSPKTDITGLRIRSVSINGKPQFLGATLILLVAGQAIDSITLESADKQPALLKTEIPNTPTPWILGLRGQMSFQQITLTLDKQTSNEPLKPITVEPPPAPPAPTDPNLPNPPLPTTSVTGDFAAGERVIAVSSTSGVIDYANIVSFEANNTYTINYLGGTYGGWGRSQLAKITGCNGKLCVSQTLYRHNESIMVIGLLPGDRFVLEKTFTRERFVLGKNDLMASIKPGVPVQTPHGRLGIGQKVLYVGQDNSVTAAEVSRITSEKNIDIKINGHLLNITSPQALAVTNGCTANGFCIGDIVYASSSDGQDYQVTVAGIQSNDFIVVYFEGKDGMVGNWPTDSLSK